MTSTTAPGWSQTGTSSLDAVLAAPSPTAASPAAPRPLRGAERFRGLDATVVEFWRYALGDLRSDAARAVLAAFLVQQALGGRAAAGAAGASRDVVAPDGTTVAVRYASCLADGAPLRASSVVFSGLRGTVRPRQEWTPTTGYPADVYVFAVQGGLAEVPDLDEQLVGDRPELEPLDLRRWQFFVLSREQVAERGCEALSLAAVQHLAGFPLGVDGLADGVRRARTDAL